MGKNRVGYNREKNQTHWCKIIAAELGMCKLGMFELSLLLHFFFLVGMQFGVVSMTYFVVQQFGC